MANLNTWFNNNYVSVFIIILLSITVNRKGALYFNILTVLANNNIDLSFRKLNPK